MKTDSCPCCLQGKIVYGRSIEFENDIDFDLTRVTLVHCPSCQIKGVDLYQEQTRGHLDQTLSEEILYLIDTSVFDSLNKKVARCPEGLVHCSCLLHKDWSGVERYQTEFANRLQPYSLCRFENGTWQLYSIQCERIPFDELFILWSPTNDVERIYKTHLFGRLFQILLGEFPETLLYIIEDDSGSAIFSFDDWPDQYTKSESKV